MQITKIYVSVNDDQPQIFPDFGCSLF